MNEFTYAGLNWFTPMPESTESAASGDMPEFDSRGVAHCGNLKLCRRLRPLAHGGLSVSLTVRNCGTLPIRLTRLIPAAASDGEFFRGTPFGQWRVYRLARQKNDVPGPFTPARPDAEMRSAAFCSAEIVAGGGLSWAEFDSPEAKLPTEFHADPGLVLLAGEESGNALFVGFSGQLRHLNDVAIRTGSARRSWCGIEAAAEFDGIELEPGGERTTHPLIIEAGSAVRQLWEHHAARVASCSGRRREAPRNIYCTWYFYGADIDQEEVQYNLEFLKRHPVAFDVFQVDMGWENNFGDWAANPEKFPAGLPALAASIRDAGFLPGIWTAPLVLEPDSEAARNYPDIILRDKQGNPCLFRCVKGGCYTLDPFAERAGDYLKQLYGRLREAGFLYHKLDFMRAVFIHAESQFRDPRRTRAEGYRRALELIREAVGEDAFLNACGGLFEGSAGLADVVRSGADLRGHWESDGTGASAYPIRIRQNICRNFYRKLWMVDPDALQLRRSDRVWRDNPANAPLSRGNFSDEEAFSITVNQFLAGGTVCVSERLPELDEDRFALYHRVIPALSAPAEWFGAWRGELPEHFATACRAPGQPAWSVVTLANWNSKNEKELGFQPIEVPHLPAAEKYAAFELKEGRCLGIFRARQTIALSIPAHGARLIRLTPLRSDRSTVVIGTSLSLTGGMELTGFRDNRPVLRPGVTAPCRVTLLRDGVPFTLDAESSFF